jgi:transposase
MTKKKAAGATPRQYDAAFKAEAVRLWQSGRDSAEKTARELGISVFNLYKWKREGAAPRAAGALRPPASKEELQGEVERLQRELARVTEQRDILKKAAGILSEPSPSGMPGFKR